MFNSCQFCIVCSTAINFIIRPVPFKLVTKVIVHTYLCAQVPISVDYKIEHPGQALCITKTNPPFPATITVKPNSNALRVMERAVNIGPTYQFKATYFGDTLGYSIDEINGVASSKLCFWYFYIKDPDGNISLSSLGPSNFFIPGRGYSIIWRFEEFT